MLKKQIDEANDLLLEIIMYEMIMHCFQLATEINMISTPVESGSCPESALRTIEEVFDKEMLQKEKSRYNALRLSYHESLRELAPYSRTWL
jgi:hypothetical protein